MTNYFLGGQLSDPSVLRICRRNEVGPDGVARFSREGSRFLLVREERFPIRSESAPWRSPKRPGSLALLGMTARRKTREDGREERVCGVLIAVLPKSPPDIRETAWKINVKGDGRGRPSC